MAKEIICAECGEKFDPSVVRVLYNQKYSPKYDYDAIGSNLCFVCAQSLSDTGWIDNVLKNN